MADFTPSTKPAAAIRYSDNGCHRGQLFDALHAIVHKIAIHYRDGRDACVPQDHAVVRPR
ncbi:hypothetical protein EDWATA_01159 [Edwardsiella tarda ATCC 23685]|uniref:Uncharacterized protein n=1 Tax=Edwardsiella tarda ATCC 23685 TaxID=500638 RepID=D4F356_EDWTA|nr:hypothetical protein EDWATA_01159 [Edwardsiella tarda ATCC 23685]